MSSIIWLNEKNGLHTYGLQILSSDKYTVENFMYNQVKSLCEKFNCKYYFQGQSLRDYGVSWAFIEFLGEGNQDTILKIIEEFNILYGIAYYNKEVLLNEPSRELLESLNLFR
jgi:hypothetical protein